MKPIRKTVFSLRVGARTVSFTVTYLETPSFRFYREKHKYPKSKLYEPVRWEFGFEVYKRGFALHHKRDLKTR